MNISEKRSCAEAFSTPETSAFLNASMPVREVPQVLDQAIRSHARASLKKRADKRKIREFVLWAASLAAVFAVAATSIFMPTTDNASPRVVATVTVPPAAESAIFEMELAELTMELDKASSTISAAGDEIYLAQMESGFGYFAH